MRIALTLNAVLAWVGLLLNLLGAVVATERPVAVDPGLYGSGGGGPLMAVVDTLCYFTIWSTVVVAVSTTLTALHPHRDTPARSALRLSGLVMITVTAVVYALVLAPHITPQGISVVSNPWVHVLVPVVTLVVWAVWGPRGHISARVFLGSLVVPSIWIVVALTRGVIDGRYPYDFMNVTALGYPAVIANTGAVVVVAVLLALAFWAVDALLTRRAGGHTGRNSPVTR